ncbi:MAG: glycerol-3-phosphate acyltransferase [bacterium]
MHTLLWSLIGYLLGSIPFSVCLGKLVIHKDIRKYGDGNPGAINAWKAGGYKIGISALWLDFLKGAIPVGIAHFIFKIENINLFLVSLTPVIGHAFSPFLKFRGGKSIAVTFGIWTGLTLWTGPTILGIALGIFYLLKITDAWSVIFSMLVLGVYILIKQNNIFIIAIWICNLLILVWKHRYELRSKIRKSYGTSMDKPSN